MCVARLHTTPYSIHTTHIYTIYTKYTHTHTDARQWQHKTLIPAFGSQRQADLCEFGASLVYKVNSRTAWAVI